MFLEKINDLFDIAHQNALELIKIEEDRLFLNKQREKGRPGSMLGVDRKLSRIEKRKFTREEEINTRREKYLNTPSTSTGIIHYSDFDECDIHVKLNEEKNIQNIRDGIIDDFESVMEFENEEKIPNSEVDTVVIPKRARKEILTPRLAAVLDKCKISERDTVHLLTAFLDAVSLDSADYITNRTSIRKARDDYRRTYYEKVRKNYLSIEKDVVTIHWDTKLLSNIIGQKVDRLAVIATSHAVDKLLGVPEIPAGTGLEICSAIYEVIDSW
ncbi:uncharacterized protein LOC126896731 [Daktulosphaira vitifoliae]|uniref:uncharacterized protein LOC126896731 n=1 Tax=Daktulosphaira vitifoliae TaxID=58002 RepID=UPI0021AA71B3|nr:uncharacterized protein LOC126896731 [Daktulosphaira vitifoliae]